MLDPPRTPRHRRPLRPPPRGAQPRESGTARAPLGTRSHGACGRLGATNAPASSASQVAASTITTLPPAVRASPCARVRHLVHALSVRGGPGSPPGAVRVPVDGGDHHRPSRRQRLALRRPSSGLEAVNLAVAAHRTERGLGVAGRCTRTRETIIATFAAGQGSRASSSIPLVDGRTAWAHRRRAPGCASLFAQPNYLGVIEDYDAAVAAAHGRGGARRGVGRSNDARRAAPTRETPGCDIAVRRGPTPGQPDVVRGPRRSGSSPPPGTYAPASARQARRREQSTTMAAMPTPSPCEPGSRTSDGRRPRRTSAPTRP